MSESDLVDFRIQISKEIGSITERLRSIDGHFQDFNKYSDAMWKKIDKINDELTGIKIRVAVVSMIVSAVVSNAGALLKVLQ